MGQINIENKSIVVPGDVLAEGMDYLPAGGAFREGEKIIASQVGLAMINARLIRVLPLNGSYIPKKDDTVIGKVTDVGYSSWFVDVGYAYDGMLSMRDATSDFVERGADLTVYFALGDLMLTKITNVTKSKAMDLTMKGPGLRKLTGGKVICVSPCKVPRIVGKQGSMITMIKDKTGCQILAGQNGRIWISGKDVQGEILATEAIKLIEEKAHVSGLTDKIKDFLEKRSKGGSK
jgi:exosome complex component RRP4